MSVLSLRLILRAALHGTMLFLLCGGPLEALELWTDELPDLPDGARSVVVDRTVTHRNGEELVARPRPYLRVERSSDGDISQTIHDELGKYLWTTEFEFQQGRISSIRAVAGDNPRWRMLFEYDDLGRPVREFYFGAETQPERTITYEYGDDVTEVVSYRADGSVAWRRTESAEEGHEERETTFFYADGSRVKTIVASVDESGRVVAEQHLDEFGAVYRTIEREYIADQKHSEVVRNDSGVTIRLTSWTYGPDGEVQSRSVELPAEGVTEQLTVSYQYNSRGHWIEQVITSRAELQNGEELVTDREVLKREIEYR